MGNGVDAIPVDEPNDEWAYVATIWVKFESGADVPVGGSCSSIKTATSWDFTVTSPRMVPAFRIVQHQIPSMLVTRLHRFNIWRRDWVVLIMLACNSRLG